MKRHIIHDTVQNQSESSKYGEVWLSDGWLKMYFRGIPGTPPKSYISVDARIIPQLIQVLKELQNERTNFY